MNYIKKMNWKLKAFSDIDIYCMSMPYKYECLVMHNAYAFTFMKRI